MCLNIAKLAHAVKSLSNIFQSTNYKLYFIYVLCNPVTREIYIIEILRLHANHISTNLRSSPRIHSPVEVKMYESLYIIHRITGIHVFTTSRPRVTLHSIHAIPVFIHPNLHRSLSSSHIVAAVSHLHRHGARVPEGSCCTILES